MPEFRKDPLESFNTIQNRHKDISEFKLGPSKIVFLVHPEYVKHVLQTNHKNYRKSREYEVMKGVLGEGLVTSDGEEWAIIRRIIPAVFTKQNMRRVFGLELAEINKTIESWDRFAATGEEIDLGEELHGLTLAVVSQALLGSSVNAVMRTVIDSWSVITQEVVRRWFALPYAHVLRPLDNIRYHRAIADLWAAVDTVIKDRRQNLNNGSVDLLQLLIGAVDEETGTRLSDIQLRDNITTFMLAGHETTASSLTWLWYLLSQHPDVEDKLIHEIDTVLAKDPLTGAHLEKLDYTRRVFFETLRLYPPAYMMARTAQDDDVVDGYKIPKGHSVLIRPMSTHKHPDFWENPNQFNPDRFEKDEVEKRHPFAYIPFGAGPRKCIGADFAITEAQSIIATVMQRFRVRIKKGHRPHMEAGVTLRAGGGLPVCLEKR